MNFKNNIEIKVIHDFKLPTEKIFDAWVNPDLVRQWWGLLKFPDGSKPDIRRIEIDARVGGQYMFSDMRSDGEAKHWGTYKIIDRPNHLVFTFFTSPEEEKEDNSTVKMTFNSTPSGCQVMLTYEMDAKYAEYAKQTETGWAKMLNGIDDLYTGDTGLL